MRVVDAIATWFAEAGVRHYFGYAGGAIWPFLDGLVEQPQIEGIQAKHESHAVHMADLYYRTTGELAPVLVTKGPGLLNCVGAAASAMHDGAAVMIIAGAGSTHLFGKAGMQELYYNGFEDATSVFRPITKGSWMVVRPDTVIDVLNQAYKLATTGRPGPVFVQVPFDVQLAPVEGTVEPPRIRTVTSRPRLDEDTLGQMVDLLSNAERPVIVAGGGVARKEETAELLRTFVEQVRIPTATTLTAKGVLDEDHELCLGPVGRSGSDAAAFATRQADVVLALGARFSDNHTSNWRKGLVYDVPTTKIIHVDLDAHEIGRNYPVAVGAQADAGDVLRDLTDALDASVADRWSGWLADVQREKAAWAEKIEPVLTASSDPVHPGRLVHEVGEVVAAANGRILVDVGDVIQYAEPYMKVRKPLSYFINAGMAEMSWASSGVLGCVAADPSRPAVVLTGDGAFNMCSQVLATAVEYDLPAIWIVLNNYELGIERKGSETAYKRSHPWVRFVRKDTGQPYNPDYAMLAEANGAKGERVEKTADLRPALDRALASGRPYVIDVLIDTSVPTFFTSGIDRAYPAEWGASYPQHCSLKVVQ